MLEVEIAVFVPLEKQVLELFSYYDASCRRKLQSL